MDENIRYIIISPVRNEEKAIELTIKSVISQIIKPILWVIVDDGSTDNTISIISKYLPIYTWIKLLKLPDRGYYDLISGGEIKAFYRGFELIKNLEYDFLSKLDGDISFDENYYKDLLFEFEKDPKLGIAGGGCFYKESELLTFEKVYKFHVRGAARVYRMTCWYSFGGTIDKLGWDAIDVYHARMLGWKTRSFNEIKMIHHVPTWTKGGLLHGMNRSGRMEYLMGTLPLFFILKCIRKLKCKPYFLCSTALMFGYLISFIKREEKVVDNELLHFIRREQWGRIRNFLLLNNINRRE